MINSESIIRIFGLATISFLLAIVLTPFLTAWLYRLKMVKQIREMAWDNTTAPVFKKLHASKAGTPTMGGILIWVTTAVLTLYFNLSRSETWLPLFILSASGFLGLIDDLMNIKGINQIKGLGMKTKFLFQFAIAAAGGWWFGYKLGFTTLTLPLAQTLGLPGMIEIGPLLYALLFILIVVFISNAVNITDGLDGLAAGIASTSFAAFALIAYAQGNVGLAAFCATIIGALLAFLWFNIYPARFFMGDTGSLALGATLATVAMLTDSLMLLPVIGIVFVVEALSSLVQRFYKRVLKKKLFISAPLHHHLEAIGWPETKVTMRFWVISAVAAVVGVAIKLIENV